MHQRTKCAEHTSQDLTNALKAKEALFSGPLLPRKPNYDSDTVRAEGRSCTQEGKIPCKSGQRQPAALEKAGLLSRRMPGLPILPGTSSSPDVPSQCILGDRPQRTTVQRGCRRRKAPSIHARAAAARTPWIGRGSPQIKMDAVSLSTCAVALPVPGGAQ